MVTRKDRRQNGYVSPQATMSKRDLIENDLFIDEFYNDWEDYRDGFRDDFRDYKRIKDFHWKEQTKKRVAMNEKQKRLIVRRKARKIRSS